MVAVLFVLLFTIAARIPVDTDTWWHLRSGQTILQSHSVPFVDSFSFTKAGQPWIDQNWLAQIVLYGCYALAGSVGLALFTATLATVGMAFIFATCRGSVYIRGIVAILSAATAAVFWSARPQMFSFVLSAVVLYLIYAYKRDPARHRRHLWLLPPIMVLWVNLHSGFAIGFIFLACAIVGEVLNNLMPGSAAASAASDARPTVLLGPLLLVSGVCVLALLFNPYTYQMLLYPFQTAGIGTLQQSIQEWASPNFHGRESWPFLILLFGTLAAVGFSKRGWDWTDLALVSVSAVLALVWQRNFAVFALAAAPALCDHIGTILQNMRLELPATPPPQGARRGVNWSILVGLGLVALFKINVTLNPSTIAQAQHDYLPAEAAAYLQSAAPPGPLFNSYNWGGYLMFKAPNYPVFVDGRTDLYGSAFLDQWRSALDGVGWQAVFAQWNIRLVVIERDSALATILRHEPGWPLLNIR
jgi:hypothetical protein